MRHTTRAEREAKARNSARTVRFDVSREDGLVLADLAHRAYALGLRIGLKDTSLYGWLMDLTAAHRNACALDLRNLLAADDFNFGHDVLGIRRHLNRETGELGGCFVPRFARGDAR